MFKKSKKEGQWKEINKNVNMLDRFVFSIVVATVFVTVLLHRILDFSYKYVVGKKLAPIDLNNVFIICTLAAVFYIFKQGKIQWDFQLVLLLQAVVLIAVHDYHYESYPSIGYAWMLPMAYIVGKTTIGRDKKSINQRMLILFFAMVIGGYIVSLLEFYQNWKVDWAYGTEKWNDFFTNQLDPRTTYELGFVLCTAAFGFAILIFKKHKILATLIIAANILAEYIVYKVEGRQNPALLVMTLIMVAAMYLFDNWSKMNAKTIKRILCAMLAIIILVVLTIIMIATNIFGLKEIYEKSYWADGGLLHNERVDIACNAFNNMLKYPLEDYHTKYGLHGGHSMNLEYGRKYGLAIFIILSLIRLSFVFDAVKMALKRDNHSWIKYLIVPGVICINIYYCLDISPSIYRQLWMLGLLISGMIRGWLEANNEIAR